MKLYETLAADLAAMIDGGALRPGERLPSVRQLREGRQLSASTVFNALYQLEARGLIVARARSGYFVAANRAGPVPEPELTRPPLAATELDRSDLILHILDAARDRELVQLGSAFPNPQLFPLPALARAMAAEMRTLDPWATVTDITPGNAELRRHIARRYQQDGADVGPDDVVITNGALEALTLCLQAVARPGDTVLVDSPGYYPLFGKLRLARANVIGVRRTAEGPDPDDLEAKAAQYRPRLFFTQTLAHNPTGTSMAPAAIHRLLQQAERLGMILVEDDPFADLLPPLTPRLATLDRLERVIYVGTFSKTLSASLRTGYIAASPALIRSLTDVKMLTVVNSSGYVERLIHELMADGHYRHHLSRLRDRVARAASRAMAELAAIGIAGFNPPGGGYYLWCPLPEGCDDVKLARLAAERGIFLAPSSIFTLDRTTHMPALRVNVAYADDAAFLGFMAEHCGAG